MNRATAALTLSSFRSSVGLTAALLVLLPVLSARGQAQTGAAAPAAAPATAATALANRLPAGCNAVMVVDVARLAESPWGIKNNLRVKLAAGYADRPLPVSAGTTRVAIGAQLNPFGLEPTWQAAVLEMKAAPQLQPMISAQGGYVDTVAGKQAAWSPRDVFYVALDANTLGLIHPGQRRQAAAWAAGGAAGGAALPPYVAKALASVGGGADAVFAIDLRDAVSPAGIAYALSVGELPSLERVEGDADPLLAALASVTGTTIVVRAGEDLQAEWFVDFDKDVSALGANANALVLDVLKSAGAYHPESDQWAFKAVGKRVIGRRAIDEEALTRLVAVLSPPQAPADREGAAAATNVAAEARPAAERAQPADAAAQASQAYYRAVAKAVDQLTPKASGTQSASALAGAARRIQQLPSLDVDPALLEWGGTVADALQRAGHELAVGSQRAQAAAAGVQSQTWYSNGGASTPESRAALRTPSSSVGRWPRPSAAASDRALAILTTLSAPRTKIRAEMSQKYRVEFWMRAGTMR